VVPAEWEATRSRCRSLRLAATAMMREVVETVCATTVGPEDTLSRRCSGPVLDGRRRLPGWQRQHPILSTVSMRPRQFLDVVPGRQIRKRLEIVAQGVPSILERQKPLVAFSDG
jgi:hypothetical protein